MFAVVTACAPIVARPGVLWHEGADPSVPGPIAAAAVAASAAAGHPPLATSGSAGRELRIWLGFGLQRFLVYVRIREQATGVHGELIAAWDERPGPDCGAETRELAAALPCTAVRSAGLHFACVLAPARPIDWPAIVRRLERQEIWNLRDDSFFPEYRPAYDGVCVHVGLRDGARWRYYTQCNPWAQSFPDARRAEAIDTTLSALVPEALYRAPWDPPATGELPAVCRGEGAQP